MVAQPWIRAADRSLAIAQGDSIQDLEFSPDGRTLAAASGDWTVALFHVDPDDAVRRLCGVLTPAVHAEGEKPPRLCR